MIGLLRGRAGRPSAAATLRSLDAVMESAASPLVRVDVGPEGAVVALVVETGPIARRQRRAITRDIKELARPLPVRTVREHGRHGKTLAEARSGLDARRAAEGDDPFLADLEGFLASCGPAAGTKGA